MVKKRGLKRGQKGVKKGQKWVIFGVIFDPLILKKTREILRKWTKKWSKMTPKNDPMQGVKMTPFLTLFEKVIFGVMGRQQGQNVKNRRLLTQKNDPKWPFLTPSKWPFALLLPHENVKKWRFFQKMPKITILGSKIDPPHLLLNIQEKRSHFVDYPFETHFPRVGEKWGQKWGRFLTPFLTPYPQNDEAI